MSTTRRKLSGLLKQVDESMGQRSSVTGETTAATTSQPQWPSASISAWMGSSTSLRTDGCPANVFGRCRVSGRGCPYPNE